MNKSAILHMVDSAYCFPVSENEIVLRLRTLKDDIVSAEVLYENKYVYGEKQKKAVMTKQFSTELYDFFSVKLKLDDTRLAYIFYINDGKQSCYFSEDGITESYDFTLGYYNFFQYPYINKADIMKKVDWIEHSVFYQIFVDRFNMGNTDKNKDYINLEWGEIPTPRSFAGGDIKGITEKLDYLEKTGINAIYLTPVFQSKSNHKYDISDYMMVDKQFGENKDLKELVDKAHEKGIRIVFDAVFNHCSEESEFFKDVLLKGKESEYYNWFVIHGDKPDKTKPNYEMFAFCDYMPKFNTSDEKLQDYLIGVACHYIEKYNIDGWRLDVSDEVSHDFWRKFRKAVKKSKEEAIIIGENWHDASNYLRGDQYDSIMNYAFTKACLDYFKTESKDETELAWKLNELLARNTDTVNSMMLNLLDSHDTHRIFSELKCNRNRIKAALSLLFFYPGVPCIYYGTEILTEGGYDPDCRRCMNWERTTDGSCDDIYSLIKALSNLRKEYNMSSADAKIYEKSGMLIIDRACGNDTISLHITNREEYAVYKNGGRII